MSKRLGSIRCLLITWRFSITFSSTSKALLTWRVRAVHPFTLEFSLGNNIQNVPPCVVCTHTHSIFLINDMVSTQVLVRAHNHDVGSLLSHMSTCCHSYCSAMSSCSPLNLRSIHSFPHSPHAGRHSINH